MAPPVVRTTATSTATAGLVPPGAAAVRLVFGGGKPVTAAISDGGEYTGAYRGHVRFYLATAAGRRRVTEVQTLDARGRLVSVTPGPDAGPGALREVARGRGHRILGARYTFRFKSPGERLSTQRATCFVVATRRERASRDDCMPLFGPFRIGRVACSPRRGLIVGKGRGARLQLAGGGTISSRAIAVPRRLGGGRLWLLEIPAGARVKRLRVGGKWQPYPVPPPRRQCGYALDPTF